MTHYDNLTFKDIDKIADEKSKATIKCKCGHSKVMPNADRTICSWCGKWVYRTKEIEFKYKLRETINKKKRDNK